MKKEAVLLGVVAVGLVVVLLELDVTSFFFTSNTNAVESVLPQNENEDATTPDEEKIDEDVFDDTPATEPDELAAIEMERMKNPRGWVRFAAHGGEKNESEGAKNGGPIEVRKVAWVVPFGWADSMQYFAPLWVKTVAASAPFLQAFVFYENPDMILPFRDKPPSNIHFICIGKDNIAQRIAAVIKKAWPDVDAYSQLARVLKSDPRKLGAYKPLFGAAFHDYIGNYSNWAWGDVDVIFGDMTGLIDASDLDEYDILSFNPGYGWYYTQGQFAILRNSDRVLSCWKEAARARELASGSPPWAWEEQFFSDWALYSSDLKIKFSPLQYEGREGHRTGDKASVIWDNGRLLVHFDYAYATAPSSPTPLPKKPLEKQCVYQTTWASPSQMSGPWFLEKLGTLKSCRWYGPLRQARDYAFTTEEWLFLHFNYVREEKKADNLAKKSRDEILDLMDSSDRLLWRHDPFDIVKAPSCGQPFGGYCPVNATPASSLPSSSLFPSSSQNSSFSFFAFPLPSSSFVTFLALSLVSFGLSFLALSFCKRRSALQF